MCAKAIASQTWDIFDSVEWCQINQMCLDDTAIKYIVIGIYYY